MPDLKEAKRNWGSVCWTAAVGVILATALGAAGLACDLEIAMAVSPSPLVNGHQAVFTITVRNVGKDACPGPTQVTAPGAPGLGLVSASAPGWICVGSTCTYLASIPAGGTLTLAYTYNVTAAAETVVTNCASVTNANDRNATNNRACLSTRVIAPPRRCDLTCQVAVSPEPLVSGQQATFTITVMNVGAVGCAVTNQVIVPPVAGLSYVSHFGAGWSCSVSGGQVVCNYPGTIPPGGTATVSLTYTVTASPGHSISFCSRVANKEDTNEANNHCCKEGISVVAGACDLFCRKIVTPTPLVSGQQATYTIVVTNAGPGPCPGPTTVQDLGGAGLQFVSASGLGWTCVGNVCTYPGPIPAAGALTVTYTYIVTAQPGEIVRNCAVVKNERDATPGNNECCFETSVVPPEGKCDLKCEKKIAPHPLIQGYHVTITVSNVGGGTCPGPTTVTDPGIPGLTFVSAAGPGWTCVGPTCTYAAPIPPGGTATVTYTYSGSPPPGTVVKNCAEVGNKHDADPTNNKCCASIAPLLPAFCCELTCLAGMLDAFAPAGTEPHNPPPDFHPEQTTPFVGFDAAIIDRWFGHRFALPTGCTIVAATLEIRVKPLAGDSSNDSLVLRIGGTQWVARFGPPAAIFLQSVPWTTANFPAGHSFTLDLANLPGGVNLLPVLNTLRLLDVIVQDDTSVDYVKLIVRLCDCP